MWPPLLVLLAPASATADIIWTESGDAGQLPGTAQRTFAFTPEVISAITGTISSTADVDLYRIFIFDPARFSATTVGQPGTLFDTQLFLFSGNGSGIEANDDASRVPLNQRSTLTAGNTFSPLVPGEYLLAISAFNNDPFAPGGLRIFPDPTGLGVVVGPTGPGGALDVTGWGTGLSTGTYQIALTGARVADVIPEPSSLLVFAMGTLGLLGYTWRKRN
jgi:hypothetical protein